MKKWLRGAVSVLGILLIFIGLTRLVVPKYMDDVLEGAFIEEYYDEETNHDVIFLGDCEVYENISPIKLWREAGITSFIRGSAQQLVWQSYYLLEDTLKYETPEVVVFNVQALMHDSPQREAYNRMTIDGMRWSKAKWDCIQVSMTDKESAIDYVFPILRYHERITELTSQDFQYYFQKRKVTHNGYYMRIDTVPFEEMLEEAEPENYTFGELPMEYMEKIRKLCEEKDIRLVLMKAPSLSPVWYDEYEEQVIAYAEEHDLLYINFLDLVEELNIDYATDTYDGGLHMNLSGAEKISVYLAKVLQEECGLTDHRSDKELAEVWKEKEDFYDQMIEDQQKELDTYGYLMNYGGSGEAREEYEEEDMDEESEGGDTEELMDEDSDTEELIDEDDDTEELMDEDSDTEELSDDDGGRNFEEQFGFGMH